MTPRVAPSGDGRQSRWDNHNQQRRQQIIDATIAVVEESEPGAEVHVQQIAERAGLSRTVVYRHFNDRTDLDRAAQRQVIEQLAGELLPKVTLDGTIPQIIERVVGTYVGWAVAHPALHRFADHDIGGDTDSPLQAALEAISGQVGALIMAGLEALGADPSGEDAAALDPLVFSLVGGVFSGVRRWISRADDALPAATLVHMMSSSVWHLIDGHARRLGIVLDPDRPVDEMIRRAPLAAQPSVAP